MSIRPWFSSLLLALSFTSMSCVAYYQENKKTDDLPITSDRISSVILIDGGVVIFDDAKGGRYEVSPVAIGVNTRGDTVRVSDITEFRLTRPDSIPLSDLRDKNICEVVYGDSNTVGSFGPAGGLLNTVWQNVHGLTPAGVTLNVPINSVVEARSSHPILADRNNKEVLQSQHFPELVAGDRQKLYRFAPPGARVSGFREVVCGIDNTGHWVSVPVDDILYVRVKHVDPVLTTIKVIGGVALTAAAAVAIVLATKQSCPFVYSYDGSAYHFDAEPLGGATTEGLARTEYSKLEALRPDSGSYRLLVRNEVDETQFIDAMSLCVVDHDPSVTPVASGSNSFTCIGAPLPPTSARDENGNDLLPFMRSSDGIAWQSHLEQLSGTRLSATRHTLTLTFPKPRTAKRALLVVHAGTTLWGSNVIRLLYELRGRSVDGFLEQADRKGPELYKVLGFLDREELYTLRLAVRKNGEWVQRGALMGGGPFLYETQVVPISVAGITGDSLMLQMHPPVGFWSFDYFGVEYDTVREARTVEVPIRRAADESGCDVLGLLAHADRQYYQMPTTNSTARVDFDVPPQRQGTTRTVFLKTTGFYRLHLAKDTPEDTATLRWLGERPGAVVEFSMKKFGEWYKPLRAALHERTH